MRLLSFLVSLFLTNNVMAMTSYADLVDEVVYLYQGETCFKGNLKQLKKKLKI